MLEILLAGMQSGVIFYLIISYAVSVLYILDIITRDKSVAKHTTFQRLLIPIFMPVLIPWGLYKAIMGDISSSED